MPEHYLTAVGRRLREADPADVTPVLLTVGACEADRNRWRVQLYESIRSLSLELRNLLVLCFREDDLPWPLPLHPVMYYFAPGRDEPMFWTYRGVDAESLARDVARARAMYHDGLSFDEATFTKEERHHIAETEAQLESEKLPSKLQLVRNLGREAWNVAKAKGRGLPVLADAETVTSRYQTCEACPHFTADGRCTQCGCFMKAKVNLAAASCPAGRWEG